MIYNDRRPEGLQITFNPPYGKSWKTDTEKMASGEDEKKKKKEILDTRFNTYLPGGENLSMIPRFSDGQLLFLLNNVSKRWVMLAGQLSVF